MKNIAQKEEKRQPKIKTEMNGKGLTAHAGLLPVLTFMEKLLFRKRVQEAVRKVVFSRESSWITWSQYQRDTLSR